MRVNVDGKIYDVPDDATPDEIDSLTRPVQQLSNPRAQAESVLATMGPIERRAVAFGEGAAHTLKQGGNLIGNAMEGLGMQRPKFLPTDEEVRESAEINAPLSDQHGGFYTAGAIAPQLLPVGGGGATVARAGLGSRLANIGTQMAIGAGQGYAFSDPDQRNSNALMGGTVGGTVAAVANPLAAISRKALDRANRAAVDLFEPSVEKLREIADKWRGRGTVEQGLSNAGKAIREAVDPATGRRLIDPVEDIGERTLAMGRVGAEGGEQIQQALRKMDELGLKGRPAEVRAQLIKARDEILESAPYNQFTPTQRRSLATIDRQIRDFDEIFGTKVKPGAVNPGVIEEESIPLTMHPDHAERASVKGVQGVPVIGESRVGAAAPDTVRVFDPPAIKGKIGRYDPKLKRMVSDVPAQPNLQASREVEIPAEAWEPWRSFTGTQRLRAVAGRPQPMPRNQYIPREVTREGVPGVGSPFQQVEISDLPLSIFEEKAKRLLGKEGFQKAGSGRYRTAEAAEGDPAIQWLRRATGILKEHTENQFAPQYFLQGKKKAQLAEVFGPAADAAAVDKAARKIGTGGSPQGFIFRRALEAGRRHTRPYAIKANESIDAIADMIPHNTDAATRAALIEMLRSKEER